jgi:transcriptional regulator GlxA family with amidase domain
LPVVKYGIDITAKSKDQIILKMKAMLDCEGLRRLTYLLEILDILSNSKEYQFISEQYIIGDNSLDSSRLNNALQYIMGNFQNEITLEEVAATVHMTRTSFCRFFKERTKRTFSDLVKDLRLAHAAKILREENISTSEAAFLSGYNNLANFNRQFKQKFSNNPIRYRLHYCT